MMETVMMETVIDPAHSVAIKPIGVGKYSRKANTLGKCCLNDLNERFERLR